MFFNGIVSCLRDIAQQIASPDKQILLRHKITSAVILISALCCPILIFTILYHNVPQAKKIFDVWYGGILFCSGAIISSFFWATICIILKKWYITLFLSCVMIAAFVISIINDL